MKNFFGAILVVSLLLSSCASSSSAKKPKATTRIAKKMPANVSAQGNALYYFLVSEIETMEGHEPAAVYYLDRAVSKIPTSAYLLMKKAYAKARVGNLVQALKLADLAYKQQPDDVDVNILLGKIYGAATNPLKAVSFYERAIRLDPDNDEAYNLLAQEYLRAKQGEKAILLLKRQISQNPESSEAYHDLARAYAAQKNIDGVILAYKVLLEDNPEDLQALQRLAEAYLIKKDRKHALEAFKKLKELRPFDPVIPMRVGLLYYELKDIDGAITTFKGLLEAHPKIDRTPYYLGLLYQEKGDLPTALHYFGLETGKSSLYKESILSRVSILKNQDRLEEAFPIAQRALKLKPKDADFYDILASLYSTARDYSRAMRVLKKGLARMPASERLLIEMGIVSDRQGDWKKGVEYMKKVLSFNEDNILALNFVGYTYADKNVHLDEAHELVSKALKLKPTDGYIMDSLAWVYYQKGQTAQALDLLEKALKLTPGEPSTLEHLGWAHLRLHHDKQARVYFERSLKALAQKKYRDESDEAQELRIRNALKGL